jgi:hypothetical protein
MYTRRNVAAIVLAAGLGLVGLLVTLGLMLTDGGDAEANESAGVEFHVGIDIDGDTTDDCTTTGDAKGACALTGGTTFTVSGYVDSFGPPLTGYDGITITLSYTGVASKDNPEIDAFWPDCVFPASAGAGSGTFIASTCAIGLPPGATSSTYTGKFFETDFNCDGDGAITVTHGKADTSLTDSSLQAHTEEGSGPDVLNITCAAATDTPTPTLTPTPTNTHTPTNTPDANPNPRLLLTSQGLTCDSLDIPVPTCTAQYFAGAA